MSDIHGNLEALNACLAHARDRGAERFAFLGDLVGYGADARAVVELVARYAAEGATVIKGNHDRAIEGGGGYFNEASRAALRWARETLTREQKGFLASLPLIEREGAICYVHASAAKPERWDYIDSPAAAKRCADAADACYTDNLSLLRVFKLRLNLIRRPGSPDMHCDFVRTGATHGEIISVAP